MEDPTMKKLTILSGVALLGLAGAAFAQPQGPGPQRPADVTRADVIQRTDAAFARLDANHDGRFTREEGGALVQQRREARRTRLFERLDADHDGQISRAEFAPHRRGPGARAAMAGAGPDGPPPPGGPRMRRHGFRGHGGPGMRMGARMFGYAGFVTQEQFRQHALERFDRADANHDGTLTVAERRTQRGQMRRHMRMGPPPGGPGAPPPPPNPAQ
jgi:EF-hand domain pair/EF hand